MNIPEHFSESLETVVRVKDPDPGNGIFLSLDPGSVMEKLRIRNQHPGSATLDSVIDLTSGS